MFTALLLHLLGVGCVYFGLGLGLAGVVNLARPIALLKVRNRGTALMICVAALIVLAMGTLLPAPLIQSTSNTRLDEFMPQYQYFEGHSIRIQATAAQVYRSIWEVTPDEIRFFQTLTWIRSPRWPGSEYSESILNAPQHKPILDVALNSGFLLLADDANQEIVMGTIPCCKRAPHLASQKEFGEFNGSGYAKATMNFLLQSEPTGWTRVVTETRVYATDPLSRRIFTVYWRIIYPGSALLRRSWLDAVKKRAEASARSTRPDNQGATAALARAIPAPYASSNEMGASNLMWQ